MPPSGQNQPQTPTQVKEKNTQAMSITKTYIKTLIPNSKTTTLFKERTNSNFKKRASKATTWLSVHSPEIVTGAALLSEKTIAIWLREILLLSSEDVSLKNSQIFPRKLTTRRSTIQIPSTNMAKTCLMRLLSNQLIVLQEKIVTRRPISTERLSLSQTNLKIGSQIHSC